MRSAIVEGPIAIDALILEVGRTANGATLLFIGTVREINNGRAITSMDYTAYTSMAERELADIIREAAERFATEDIVVEHRVGSLGLGDASVAIAVAHPHRAPAYEASRYVIEQLKQRVPIWKLEYYVDGSREWVGTGKRIRGAARAVHDATGATADADSAAPGDVA